MSSDTSYLPYDRRAETDGTWTVVDAITGHPATIGYKQLSDLTGKDASEFMEILNRNTDEAAWRRLPRYAIQGLPAQISGVDLA
ncbi:hypothetical protein [Rhizobium yanglingense]